MNWQERCQQMVKEQIVKRGIRDPRVIDVMSRIPRHIFVDVDSFELAYEDHPVRIGESQTISQPFIVALMTSCLKLTGAERVLEVGTGSGYQTALLAELSQEVYTIEKFPSLSIKAQGILDALNYNNITYYTGDGSLGIPMHAPYDSIIVTAAAPRIPDSLFQQLAINGKMVIPVGERSLQELYVVNKDNHESQHISICGKCVFVPLIGKEGWDK